MGTAAMNETKNEYGRKSGTRAAWAMSTAGVIIALSAAMVVSSASPPKATSTVQSDRFFQNLTDEVRTFTVDAALGKNYYQNSKDPSETLNNPLVFSPGDTFFQDGAFYPEGTIPPGSDTFDLDTPGAIGSYKVRGTWITDLDNFNRAMLGDRSAAPAMAFATEILTFGNDGSAILTDGMYPNAYFSARRVILGGTGRFRNAVGEVDAQNIGETSYGCNFRLKFKIHGSHR